MSELYLVELNDNNINALIKNFPKPKRGIIVKESLIKSLTKDCFKINLNESNKKRFNSTIAELLYNNPTNLKAIRRMFKRFKNKKLAERQLNRALNKVIKLKEEQNIVDRLKTDVVTSTKDLTIKNPERFNIKSYKEDVFFLGFKSFKVYWDRYIKGPKNVISIDDADNDKIKYYVDRPIFHVTEDIHNYIKSNFTKFPNRFYDYIDYLMNKIEKEKQKLTPDYTLDRTIFLVTLAKNKNFIDDGEDGNIIAINTEGHNRPTLKGDIKKLSPDEIKKLSYKAPILSTAPQQQSGAGMSSGLGGGL